MDQISVDVKKKMMTAAGLRILEVSWEGEGGDLTAVFGPSGAGKTTLLRMLAGLTAPDEGRIAVGGETWFDSSQGIDLPPQRRSVGVVFQEYSLFPNMTILENIAYALCKGEGCWTAGDLLELGDLNALADRYPAQLSGGQQQRVALIRALARDPRVLLLDEPLSALDIAMRAALQDHILAIKERVGVTTLMVTHDLPEVFKMADKVMVLKEGKISRTGAPYDVFTSYALSSKFKFVAQVVDIAVDGFISVFSLRIGSDIVRVVDTDIPRGAITVGDHVVVASKAFNPVIMKCEV